MTTDEGQAAFAYYTWGNGGGFVDANGDWWLYYHAYTSLDGFRTRHFFMDKMVWDEDGFPHVENKTPSFQQRREGPSVSGRR